MVPVDDVFARCSGLPTPSEILEPCSRPHNQSRAKVRLNDSGTRVLVGDKVDASKNLAKERHFLIPS
jgi:hypothetical protein